VLQLPLALLQRALSKQAKPTSPRKPKATLPMVALPPMPVPWGELPVVARPAMGRVTLCVKCRDGQAELHLPSRLTLKQGQQLAQPLLQRVQRRCMREYALLKSLPPASELPRCAFTQASQVAAYVQEVNQSTFNHTGVKVALGKAKYSRLGQYNKRSHTVTLSWYALQPEMPLQAVRYLIIHELAHVLELNHSPRFWAHVARHEPNYRYWDKVVTVGFTFTTNGWPWPSLLSQS
jgi:hypothetical protein